ncbi:MAG: histidyl-tRNA synthetase [Parcubacteria group bacterium GW2011_GWB1_50_9]|uniref:Histidyl-tRNA synthetase n=1 Tax=Candidatus Adlerbacteria bacterium GW2011_GWC1_50_9 TaxID=1618608 RepID=A0A0G1YUI0_9BACT|nr:MAG: histidyl-tRNA synthetase [Parcubacteria group bacterium GW2011_GWB1_50_9]KKW18627.1 MAG: histidyl-tRNA synthetase [Candidatus Adlerbacteria bacterium GW2011_GWC1_50_9]KKW32294.1 MAG: histidyl-tRNA synthetase [Parcubacteria group bacterium GW2011_GWA1_53_13]
MIRLKDTVHQNTSSFLSSAVRVAEYYGFVPFEEAMESVRKVRVRTPRGESPNKDETEIMFARREERPLAVIARRCAISAESTDASFLAWRTGGGTWRHRSGMPALTLELHIVGVSSAIAEALLIIVTDAITAEAGIGQRILSINNIGSIESSNRYMRDVSTYLRKHIESISPTLRPRAATDPMGTLVQLIERGHPAVSRAPQAMEYLTEDERRRFWEILEYLEIAGLPYELSPHVLGSRECWSHSLFEISAMDNETGGRITLAFGGRYDPLTSRFARAPLPSVMISITCEMRGRVNIKQKSGGQPSIYFAHLGSEARRRALPVLENLRKEGIPIYQGLLHERIGDQMALAHQHAVPYILIMGHKEAVEETMLVRETATNSQEAVPLTELTNYLKRRRIVTDFQAPALRD